MTDTVQQTMKKAERLAIKIKKKINRNDLDFSVQTSISTADPGQIYYAMQITSVAEGVAPMTFIDKDPVKFIEKIEAQVGNIDEKVIEKAYHEAQIAHAKRTIKFHEERIEEITADDSELQEGEIVDETNTEK